jgi:RimJ/RimL family protein N-acetyltransferase
MRFPDDVPRLTDGVVTLRAARTDDVPGVVEQCLDPVSTEWTTVPLGYTDADAVEYLTVTIPEGWRTGQEYVFVVESVAPGGDTGVGRYVGNIGLRMHGGDRAEVAYGAHPWARGQGLLARAVRLLVRWGFDDLGLRTTIWWANRGNWPSRRLAWSLGFALEGAPRAWLPQRGQLKDAWVGTLLRGDPMRPTTPWRTAVPLADGRVSLRPADQKDDRRIVEACNDPQTSRWLGDLPAPYAESDARWWRENILEQQAEGRRVAWIVADPVTDELLGAVDLFAIREGWDAEIGYWAHPSARGKGITSAACRLVLAHAFRPLEQGGLALVRVQGVVAEGNDASAGVLERIGMQRAGVYRAFVQTRSGRADGVLYDVLER